MNSACRFERAVRLIRSGGVIAYPTGGVYGLGCDPANETAVRRILAIKRRPWQAGLILIASAIDQFDGWIAPSDIEWQRIESEPAAGITWLVTPDAHSPSWITGAHDSIAVRVVRHPVALTLCRRAGTPIVSTSANRRGRPPARTALAARLLFGREIDLVVAGGPAGIRTGPSEIRDARSGAIVRPRAGSA